MRTSSSPRSAELARVLPMRVLSLGREVEVWSPRIGVVHSVFDDAVNLLVAGELWTVLGAARPDSAFGIRLRPFAGGLDVRAADPVHARAGYVRVGCEVLDCRTAPRWAPTRWAPPLRGLGRRLRVVEQAAATRAWRESASMAGEVTDALHAADRELAAAVRHVVGRGPGLTPSGDDVLVGILAVFTSGAAGLVGARSASRLASALTPLLASTSDVSRHLLQQAARGLPGGALHDLGHALMQADGEVLAASLDRVLDTGCTSGADACMGLAAACRHAFLDTEGPVA